MENHKNEMELEKQILFDKFLNNMPFYDFSIKNLEISCQESGFDKQRYLLHFPEKTDLIDYFHSMIDSKTIEKVSEIDVANMKIRDRIKTCLETRFQILDGYKFAVSRFIAFNLLSLNLKSSCQHIWNSVDSIWKISLDKSTDYNYYTKRIILANLYVKTFMFWLSREEEDQSVSDFLDVEIEKILKLNKNHLQEKLFKLKNKIPFIRLINFKK